MKRKQDVTGEDGGALPVPGGIGSVTTAVTLDHVVMAAERAAR